MTKVRNAGFLAALAVSVLSLGTVSPALAQGMSVDQGEAILKELKAIRARLMVKRVVALPGDRVELREERLWLDGRPLEEPYLAEPRVLAAGAVRLLALQLGRNGGRVPPGHLIALGDNVRNSFDSGDYGLVSLDQAVGRVTP